MPLKLIGNLRNSLLLQPESGMGYQIVSVALRYQPFEKQAIVFNGEYLFFDFECDLQNIRKVFANQESRIPIATDVTKLTVKTAKQKLSIKEFLEVFPVEMLHRYTKREEKFVRFNGFENDNRINPDGGLVPGTYATTEQDALNVIVRMDAVRRYALPPPNTAQYRFTIAPLQDTEIKQGIAQPNFGHPGGGVEIVFVDGTTKKTVKLPPEVVPEK
jgi:hypothetical protein